MNISSTPYAPYQTGINFDSNRDDTLGKARATGQISQEEGFGTEKPNPDRDIVSAGDTQAKDQTGADSQPSPSKSEPQGTEKAADGGQLSAAELKLLYDLKKTDTEVRQHEMAHIAAGGRYITSGANFTYRRGPDGKNYAVGGEVSIDTAPVPGDPQATIQKMRQVKSSALAPASPSPQDRKVAAKATQQASKASSELMILQAKQQAAEHDETTMNGLKKASDTYQQISNFPENETSSFEIAV